MTLEELELRVRLAAPDTVIAVSNTGTIYARKDNHNARFYLVSGSLCVDREWSVYGDWTVGIEDRILSVTAHQLIAARRRLAQQVPA